MFRGLPPLPVAALLGPTAAGKSSMATELATRLGAEIVSIDSMQVYRGMDIGTAKPDVETRSRVPHHLLDIAAPSEDYTVADFQVAARRAVEEIAARGRLPLLVGGTGLYFEAVVFDLRFPPGSADDDLRRHLEDWASRDPEGIRSRLREVDPEFAARQDLANIRRVVRAMEVYERTGKPISSYQHSRESRRVLYAYTGAVLDPPREALYAAIEARVDRMVDAGLVEEVRKLAGSGGFSRTARQALGYKEILEYLDTDTALEETICKIKKRSRRYAKRQLTWFKHIPGLQWFQPGSEELAGKATATLQAVYEYFHEEIDRETRL